MPTNILFSIDKVIRGLNRDENFSYSLADNNVDHPAISELRSSFELTYNFDVNAITVAGVTLTVDLGSLSSEVIIGESADSPVGTIITQPTPITYNMTLGFTADGHVEDTGRISGRLRTDKAGSKRFETEHLTAITTRVQEITNLVHEVGSMGGALVDKAVEMVNGLTPNDDTIHEQFATFTFDFNAPAATLNPSRFYAEYDFSGMSFMWEINPLEYQHRGGFALISNRHGIGTTHFNPAVGRESLFRRRDGTFQRVTVLAVQTIGSPIYPMHVAYFDQEITDTSIFTVMPDNWMGKYIPSATIIGAIEPDKTTPTFFLGKHKISHTTSAIGSDQTYGIWYGISKTHQDDRLSPRECQAGDLYEWCSQQLHGGDSSSPCFFLLDGQVPIMLGSGQTEINFNDVNYVANVNIAMNEMAAATDPTDPNIGSYAVMHPDLSGFIRYD